MARLAARRRSGETFASLVVAYERESPRGKWLHSYDKARLLRAFGSRRLGDLKEKHVTDYGLARSDAGEKADVINDELRTLGDILVWARETGRVATYPKIQYMRIHRPPEPPRRSSFAEAMLQRTMRQPDQWAPLARSPQTAERGELSNEAWTEHLRLHPKDGKRLSYMARAKLLKSEQGITISKTTVGRRFRQPGS